MPMLPEPTLPKRAAARARPQTGVMTPLFSVPDDDEPGAFPPPGRRVRQPSTRTRRPPANGTKTSSHVETSELLAVTAERLRRSLARSFLRYGLVSELEAAVHAAMNVVEPVLEARDTEILRLRQLMAGKRPSGSRLR
jgi:hypothetical protein